MLLCEINIGTANDDAFEWLLFTVKEPGHWENNLFLILVPCKSCEMSKKLENIKKYWTLRVSHRLYWESTHRKWKARTGNLGPRQRNQYQGKAKHPGRKPQHSYQWTGHGPPAAPSDHQHCNFEGYTHRPSASTEARTTELPSGQTNQAANQRLVFPSLWHPPWTKCLTLGLPGVSKLSLFQVVGMSVFSKERKALPRCEQCEHWRMLGLSMYFQWSSRLSHPLVSSWCGQREWLFFHASFVCHLQKAVSLSMEVTETDRSKLREDRCLPLQLHPENQWPSTVERQETFLQTMGWYQNFLLNFIELILNLILHEL